MAKVDEVMKHKRVKRDKNIIAKSRLQRTLRFNKTNFDYDPRNEGF